MWKRGVTCALLLLAASVQADQIPAALSWAYPSDPIRIPFPRLPPETVYRVEGSPLSYSGEQLNEMGDVVDWLPSAHPPVPDLVTHSDHGRKLEACGGCHGIAGQGSIEIPNLAGLPADYIAEQIGEFAGGRRHSSAPDRDATVLMIDTAGKLTATERTEAAKYYASIAKRAPWVKVIEADQAPVTKPIFFGWTERVPAGGTEPLGRRVIEVAVDLDQMLAGDPHSGIVAYAPIGAVERGKVLVKQGAQPCVSCHGATFKGIGKAPPLAGRDPHYLARALWDIKSGARSGPAVALMQKPAAAVTEDQIVDLVAYLASLTP